MKKVKTKKKLIPLLLAVVATFGIFTYAKSISAEQAENVRGVELKVEKIDRDTVKISLDNFEPSIKSLQFGLRIDGNAKFVENGVKSLITSNDKNMKTNIKLSDDKKGIEIFIVSTEALDRNTIEFDICEIDLEKTSDKKTGFSITPYSLESNNTYITYVLSDTNKREEEVLATESQNININSAPKIELKESPFVIDGKIILTKGKEFKAEDYVTVTDEDGTAKLEYTGLIKINTVGVYNVTYTAIDDYNDKTVLEVSVVVEEADSNPIINIENSQIVNSTITINEGEEIDLLDGIVAYDFRGRKLDVKVSGDYDFNTPGIYPITLAATDIHGNKADEISLVLVVKGIVQPVVKPVITVSNKTITIKKGENVNLLDGVTAVDYLGQQIEVVVTGDYDVNKVGTYTIKYNATDSLGNKADEVTATLVVEEEKIPTDPSEPSEPGNPGTPEEPSEPSEPGNPGTPEEPSEPSEPGNPETPEEPSDPSEPSNPSTPENPSKPGDTGNGEVTINPGDTENSGNTEGDGNSSGKGENDLPATGQGIYFGIIVFVGIVIIGSGVFLLSKSKKRK